MQTLCVANFRHDQNKNNSKAWQLFALCRRSLCKGLLTKTTAAITGKQVYEKKPLLLKRRNYRMAAGSHHNKNKTIALAMRFTAILLTVVCLTTSAKGISQKVTLDMRNAPVQKVFREVIRQTGVSIIYDIKLFEGLKPVTIKLENASVNEVINRCLQGQPFTYSIENNTIIIKRQSNRTERLSAFQQDQPPVDVSGRVIDKEGHPLAEANIKVKGSGNGTTTNENGEFTLKDIDENAVLEISYIGYETQIIPLKGKTNLSITLAVAVQNLNAVVVNKGYYSTTQRLNTGNVASINSRQIENQPVNNPLLALVGRLPGVLVTQNSGLPGAGISVIIRGKASIGSGTDPLYIIDGVPYAPSVNLTNLSSAAPGESPFISINPADIESIDILKDADATAIYGSRGANGVILITTKKAKAGQTSVSVNIKSGIGQVGKRADLMNLQQYLQLRQDAFDNDGVTPTATNAPDLLKWDQSKITEWQDLFFGRTAHFTDAQVGVSGGTSLASIYFNTGYHNETTVFAPSDLGNKRYSGKLNADLNSRDMRFNMNSSIEYAITKNTLPRQDGTQNAYGLPPHFPLYNPDGTPNWSTSFLFPLAFLTESSIYKTQTIIGNSMLRYRLLPNLSIKANFGYSRRSSDQMTLTPFAAQNPAYATRRSQFADNYVESYIIEPQLDYTYRKKRSEFSVLIGGTLQQTRSSNEAFSATGFSSDASLSNLGAAGTVTVAGNSSTHYRYNSAFGRLSYNWAQKYLANITLRRDGSSRFGPGKRFGNFGALGLGWIFSEASFVKQHLSFLSFGKLRGSYGLTGNDQIGDYRYLTTFSSGTAYQEIGSLRPTRVVNQNFGWEVNHKLEFAAELGFLKDRINLSLSFYRNRSNNALVYYPIPAITGFTSYQGNLPALVQNKGWEFLLSTTNIKAKDFTWRSSFNLSLNRNKLLNFPGIEKTSYANIYAVGYSLNRGKMLHFTGVDPETGLAQFEDVNKDGTVSFITDGKYYDNDFNKFFGGLTNTVNYKNFQLDFSLDFIKKVGKISFVNSVVGTMQNQYQALLGYWKNPGDITDIPKPSTTPGKPGYTSFQNWWLSDAQNGDASYIKLRNASLSYHCAPGFLQRYHINKLDVYVTGENLFSFAGFKSLDPETGNFAIPPIRVITAGIRCQF